MLKKNDRVRFIDEEKNELYGVLIIFEITGQIVTLGKGGYENFGSSIFNANLNELKKTED